VARVVVRGPTDSTSSVALFDGSILATAGAWHAAATTMLLVLDDAGEVALNPRQERWSAGSEYSTWRRTDGGAGSSRERYDALGAKDDKLTCAGTTDARTCGVVSD
jgi:hypothetical protein